MQRTGAAAAALALPELQRTSRFKMGLQLYTVRAPMRTDVAGTLQKIAAMGYEEAETYGFDPDTIGFYGMPAKVFAQVLKANGVTTPSGHYDLNRYAGAPMDELTRYVDRCIEGAKVLGQSYITWPYLDEPWRTLDKIRIVAERLNRIGAQIKKSGLQLAYHHHDFEFVNQNGQIGFDIILKETDPALVKLQTDLYWMAHAGRTCTSGSCERRDGSSCGTSRTCTRSAATTRSWGTVRSTSRRSGPTRSSQGCSTTSSSRAATSRRIRSRASHGARST